MTKAEEAAEWEKESAKQTARENGLPEEMIGEYVVKLYMPKGKEREVLVELMQVVMEVKLLLRQPSYITSLGIMAARQITAELQEAIGCEIKHQHRTEKQEAPTPEVIEFGKQIKEEGFWDAEQSEESRQEQQGAKEATNSEDGDRTGFYSGEPWNKAPILLGPSSVVDGEGAGESERFEAREVQEPKDEANGNSEGPTSKFIDLSKWAKPSEE